MVAEIALTCPPPISCASAAHSGTVLSTLSAACAGDPATATVTVVAAPISATDDTTAPVNGGTGAPAVIDALPNDNLNGAPATIATVTVAVVTPATPIAGGPVPVLDPATGLVTVPANTPAGTYTIAQTQLALRMGMAENRWSKECGRGRLQNARGFIHS